MDDREFFRSSKARTERGLITFNLDLDTAIVDRVINSPGTLFYLDKTSTGICTVEGSVDQGTTRDSLLASPGFSLFNESGFSGFRISAPAQPGKTLRIVIASGVTIKPGDAVTSGSVATQTVDAGLARTRNGQAFLRYTGTAAVAGELPHGQLWNPHATKSVILESMVLISAAAQMIYLGDYSAILGGSSGQGFSKYSGGARSNALGVTDTDAASLLANTHLSFPVLANTPFTLNFREPIEIPPGRGYGGRGSVANTDLTLDYEYYET